MSIAALVAAGPLGLPPPALLRLPRPLRPAFLPPHRTAHLLRPLPPAAYVAGAGGDAPSSRTLFNLDAVLSAAEVLCLAPPLVFSIGAAVGCFLPGGAPKLFHVSSGNVLFAGQLLALAAAVLIGGVIRQRQWRRGGSGSAGYGYNLAQRIEKVEEDIRSSTTIVRVLSRQLEKLGIRFRVTRRTLKDPISETAMLAQKNSEATRFLALQADILEKELKEIQKVLLIMQDQQQKQLDLILAIANAGKQLESNTKMPSGQNATGNNISVSSEKKEVEYAEAQSGGNNDKA